jgi:hypothetical protein
MCEKHLASGNDLRVPLWTIEVGLQKIYDALRGAENITVVTLYEKMGLDPDSPRKERCLDDLGKLLRTLRANGYVTKTGHAGGYVSYSATAGAKWNLGVSVSIDDVPTNVFTPTASQVKHIQPETPQEELRGRDSGDDVYTILRRMEQEMADMKVALKAVFRLLEEQRSAPTLCPIAKLKMSQHPLIRGTAPEEVPTVIGDKATEKP